jgi:hypothetical protein
MEMVERSKEVSGDAISAPVASNLRGRLWQTPLPHFSTSFVARLGMDYILSKRVQCSLEPRQKWTLRVRIGVLLRWR